MLQNIWILTTGSCRKSALQHLGMVSKSFTGLRTYMSTQTTLTGIVYAKGAMFFRVSFNANAREGRLAIWEASYVCMSFNVFQIFLWAVAGNTTPKHRIKSMVDIWLPVDSDKINYLLVVSI